MTLSADERRRSESLDRPALVRHQLERLNRLLATILPQNRFYAEKLAGVTAPLASLDELATLPFTTKDELLVESGPNALPANLTWPIDSYVRYHQTSGTRGRPLPVFDAADDWEWWIDCWQYVLDAAGVTASDRAMLAFSFGPFIGFWSAHDALVARGAMVIPGGGMTTHARLDLIFRTGATVLLSTPSYALHLVDEAAEHKFDLTRSAVRKIIVAGEPGGSIPAFRERIESAWGAEVIDHAGASEVGPWGYADRSRRGLHIIETEFIAEFQPVECGDPALASGPTHSSDARDLAHLILTSLGRPGMPVIRYRTGDLVRPVWSDEGPNHFVLLEGGVVGRVDDMLIVRGVNVFPASVETILRGFPELVEYRLIARKQAAMDELIVEVEDRLEDPRRIVDEMYLRLGLRVEVRLVPPLSLPRYDGKGRRFVDER